MSRYSSVDIATRYGLDGPGSNADPNSRALAGVAGSNPAGGLDVCVVCCTVKGQKAKPEQSGLRSTDKVEREKKNRLRARFSAPVQKTGPGVQPAKMGTEFLSRR